MILTVTFNPAIDKTAEVNHLVSGGLNRLFNVRQDAGGKGINVSKTLKALGTDSTATGFLAGDAGKTIETALEARGIPADFVWADGQTRTNLKVLDEDMALTELNEPGPAVNEEQIEELMKKIEDLAGEGSWVVLSGNVGPGVSKEIYRVMIERLKKKGIRCILDADGELFREGIKAGPYAIKPNRYELAQYFGMDEENLDLCTLIRLARKLLNDETKLVAVSMGTDGSVFITEDGIISAPALKIDYQSAVGAGDAMVAAMTDGLNKNMDLQDLVRWAVAVSAGACTTQGTQPAELPVVEELAKRVEMKVWEEK